VGVENKAATRRWVDLLLLLGTLWMLGLVAKSAVQSANVKADTATVSQEAERLYDAFSRFHEQNGRFPGLDNEDSLEPASLNPLRERGYYKGHIVPKLADGRVDAYSAADGRGDNDEFWLEMSLDSDPSIRFLVVRSDDAPLGGGRWREGAFVYRDGVLRPL